MQLTRRIARLAASAPLLVAGWALPLVTAAPAQAAGCSSSSGVSVVVDYHSLGGGVQSQCVTDGGGAKASTLFSAAGFPLTYAQREPGFVCRVTGVPTSDPCVNTSPANAYWGLWWSDGTSGTWTYSSLGVQSLSVPDGGSVAFSWDDVSGNATPSTAPRRGSSGGTGDGGGGGHQGGGGGGGGHQGGGGTGGSPSEDPSPSTGDDPSDDGSTGPGARGDRDGKGGKGGKHDGSARGGKHDRDGGKRGRGPNDPASPSAPDATDQDGVSITEADTAPASNEPAAGGLPGWVPPGVVLLLLGAGGAAALVRRRKTG